MTIPDANILIYAYNEAAPQHRAVARWLEDLFAGSDVIGFPWQTLWAFARIATNPRAWPNPLPAESVFSVIREWLSLPGVVIVQPGQRHADLLEMLVLKHGATGPLLSDAALAAIAIESGAMLASTDQDFARFEGLRWINPLDSRSR